MSFMNKELSDDLLPFSGKLSERFYEVRENVAGFCAEIEKIGAQLGSLPTRRPPLAHTAATHPRRQKRLRPQFGDFQQEASKARDDGGGWHGWLRVVRGGEEGSRGQRWDPSADCFPQPSTYHL